MIIVLYISNFGLLSLTYTKRTVITDDSPSFTATGINSRISLFWKHQTISVSMSPLTARVTISYGGVALRLLKVLI